MSTSMHPIFRQAARQTACTAVLLLAAGAAGAAGLSAPDIDGVRRNPQADRRDGRPDGRPDGRQDRDGDRNDRSRPPSRVDPGWRIDRTDRPDRQDNPWHGHGHVQLRPGLPLPGAVVRVLPSQSRWVAWGGNRYHHHDGVWYRPASQGWLVVRPPIGLYVRDLPLWRTVLVVGGVSYLVANGVYYREHPDQGYEVVAPPPAVAAPVVPVADNLPRQYVYPRLGQSADQQASDEYECHRWAVGQTGFDPTASATGNVALDASRRDDYLRARGACLDGRGYTVR